MSMRTPSVYVASSWRNAVQPEVVTRIRAEGWRAYDFRAPDFEGGPPGGFSWAEIDADWRSWTATQYRAAFEDARVQHGLARDFAAMAACDACVMVQPCGVSAALELGWCLGAGKLGIVLVNDAHRFEPELMLGLAVLALSLDEVVMHLRHHLGAPSNAVRRCRKCGCTDDDCGGCVIRTGEPCTWVEADLCSACVPAAG